MSYSKVTVVERQSDQPRTVVAASEISRRVDILRSRHERQREATDHLDSWKCTLRK